MFDLGVLTPDGVLGVWPVFEDAEAVGEAGTRVEVGVRGAAGVKTGEGFA